MDREVEQILDTITQDEAFTRLIAKRAPTLTAAEVRASLRRSGLRSFYPRIEAFMARLDGQPSPVRAPEPAIPATPSPVAQVNGDGRASLMKTAEMVERGLLPVGATLTIRDRPDSAARVVDGKRVEFRGEVISFNDWGCRATGWTAIQIYKWAVLPDGRLLETLREGVE